MKKFRIIGILLGFMACAIAVNAQSGLAVDVSQMYTTFKFTDSQGTKLNGDYSGVFSGAYGASYRLVTSGGFMLNVRAGMRKAGATMVYDNMSYKWDLQYVDGRLGLGYMYTSSEIRPYFMVSGYFGYLVRGFQTINNENFDIRDSKAINNLDYGVIASPGVQFELSKVSSVFAEFNYLMGLANIDNDASQKASNIGYGLTVGFQYKFGK